MEHDDHDAEEADVDDDDVDDVDDVDVDHDYDGENFYQRVSVAGVKREECSQRFER